MDKAALKAGFIQGNFNLMTDKKKKLPIDDSLFFSELPKQWTKIYPAGVQPPWFPGCIGSGRNTPLKDLHL